MVFVASSHPNFWTCGVQGGVRFDQGWRRGKDLETQGGCRRFGAKLIRWVLGVFVDNRSAVDLSSADANDLRRFSMRLGIKY